MKKNILPLPCLLIMAACSNNPDRHGTSVPIDSSNVNGAAPASYGPQNPTADTMPKTNVDDTATKANNVHNTGYK
jgi:hypothetical protein